MEALKNNIKKRKMEIKNYRSPFIIKTFLCMIIFIIVISSFVTAVSESYKPYLHKPSVGQYPKLETFGNYQTQSFPGSASYNYNLIVSPGTNGLSPKLLVSYNSQSAFQNPSIIGAGWTITQNYILRNVNFTVNSTIDDSYILYLNGYSDKVINRNGSYKTFIDTYLKIENKTSGGNQYWLVTSTDGTKYTFGLKSTSALRSNSSNYTLKWFLDSIEDTNGNAVNYSYVKNPYSGDIGAIYSSNITYNKDQLRKIIFRYDNSTRPDKRVVYEQGSRFLEMRRLVGVDMYFNNSQVRRYDFTYINLNTEKTMSSLSNITYIGADNSSVLHRISFEYFDAQVGFDNSSKWLIPEEFTSIDPGSQDFGSRLVDVNNDGFVDIVKSNSTGNSTRLNDKNSTWNSTTLFSVPEQIVDSTNKYQGVILIDINKDGLVDLLKAKSGTSRKTYLNNGTAWRNVSNITWVIPVDFINSSSGDEGIRFLELNGDGLVDIVQGKASGSTKISWLNNGSGWINSSFWRLPDYFISVDGNDTGLREIDLNGDGLTDLLKGGQPGSAWLNNGTGWVNETSYAPSLDFTNSTYPDLGVRFMDINGDVLTDILQNFYSNVTYLNQTCLDLNGSVQNCTLNSITNFTNVKINNGSGWVFSALWQSPEYFTSNGFNTGRRIADVNGDGYSDIVVGFKNGTIQKKTVLRNATSSFILKKIKHEYGGTTSIIYDKSTLSNNGRNLGFNIWLATNITANNSLNGSFILTGKTTYRYSDGKFDYQNSEFLGFGNANETLPDGSIISHYFHQDSILKGKEYTTIIYDVGNKRLKQILNRYTNSTDYKIYLNASSELNYEGNPTPVTSNITYTYDTFGNIVYVNNSGNIAITGDEKYETYVYIYNTTAYIVNKPSNYSLQNSSFSLLKRSWFYYDSLVNRVTKGDLTRIIQYNNKGQNPESNYSYDSYGNVIREIDPLGNEMNYTMDSATNTFVTRKTNALGHRINYDYDKGTGNILFEEKDGNSRNYTYDTFGRITKEYITPDNVTLPTKRTTYDFDGNSPERIVVETKNNNTDYSESIYFYDGFANPVQIKLKYSSATQIIQSYLYDNKSRIKEDQVPYFQTYSTQMNTTASGFFMRYAYDAMDRVINITKKDNSITRTLFNNTKVVSTNELGIQKEYYIDTYGRIKNVIEHNRNSSGTDQLYNTSYYYDATDNLIKVVDAQGNNFTFEYDTLGRKISIDDPNMEKWNYSYDLNSNLVNQTDGRGVTVYLAYDKLNRPINKSSGNSTVIFTYDKQFNSTLSTINYSTYFFDQVFYNYTYDNRLRVTQEKLYIDYIPDDIGLGQASANYWINTSFEYDSSDKLIKKNLPNQTFDYKFETGSNISIEKLFPNSTLIFEYNSINKIRKINDFVNLIEYNAFIEVLNKTYTNGLVTKYSYDNVSRINQISTGNVQNLSYSYDLASNVKQINDSRNKIVYNMSYDDIDRLIRTIIYNFNTFEHEKYIFNYNKIGGLISTTKDETGMNYTYTSLAHAPTLISTYNRSIASINLSLVNPTTQKNVTKNNFFNFTLQVCCLNNDCWGINVSLDPEENTSDQVIIEPLSTNQSEESIISTPLINSENIKHSYSPNSESTCSEGVCNTIYYSESRFVYENKSWKNIENAQSLKSVWYIKIDEDSNFPATIIDFNYTTITLNLSVSNNKLGQNIPLKVYNKNDNSQLPKDSQGNEINMDKSFKFTNVVEIETVTIDLSNSVENLLMQEIKWGDASTIITVYDNNSINLADSYIQNAGSSSTNFGTNVRIQVRNSSTSTQDSLIKFDTSQIPRQALIDEARLFLYIDSNDLDVGEDYNVSVHSINQSYLWIENGIDWDNKPLAGINYTSAYLDKIKINNTDSAKYVSWNVTLPIKNKNRNESFYITAIENQNGDSGDAVQFRSKEHPGVQKSYLNVTYRLKNLVSTTIGETPFYTTNANPRYVDLEQNQCLNITWAVNATGSLGNYIFYGYANKTDDNDNSAISGIVDVTIV